MRDTPRGLRADEREGAGVLFEGMGASWMRGSGWLGWGTDGGGRGALQIEGGAMSCDLFSGVFVNGMCARDVRAVGALCVAVGQLVGIKERSQDRKKGQPRHTHHRPPREEEFIHAAAPPASPRGHQ